jgi:hypothetical protein
MTAPDLGDPAQQALLLLLCQLARFELRLLAQVIFDTRLPDDQPRSSAAVAVLRLLDSPAQISQALSVLLGWRPDLALLIQKTARQCGVRASTSTDLHSLARRGVVKVASAKLQIRSAVRVWWLLEALSAVARGDVGIEQWMLSQGLVAPSAHAITHLQWRIGRLEGLLSRGARPLIAAAAI